ncbi:MAG: tRNA guanosine(34) transglycosylase Tgt [bacterium]|nr:tRNA guanosine(34) transglycosylase Tgt [bacterium]
MATNFNFNLEYKSQNARAGRIRTVHAEIETPVFMPVGTFAAIRNQSFDLINSIGYKIVLANTYHLLLRPGVEVFEKFSGIHRFMQWSGAVLTDSGGFQIFSLPYLRKMTEEGANFKSYVEGKNVLLTPESSIATQRAINSDIMMVLDQCVPSTSDHATAKEAMELTHRWAMRSLKARGDSEQALFAITQGALHKDLRRQSAEVLCAEQFDGFAIGGLAVGESKDEREECSEYAVALLPQDKPRYLMGVGTPIDLLEAVKRGVDMFDCIIPTALAVQGVAYSSRGKINLRRGVYKFADQLLDPNCTCNTCSKYSRAYLHHLTKTEEPLGAQLIGAHNLHFYFNLMSTMRKHIISDTFSSFYKSQKDILGVEDLDNPPNPPNVNPPRSLSLGRFQVLSRGDYSSIIDSISSEVMHSVNDPIVEARTLYVDQSDLTGRVNTNVSDPLVIWDVGLGAAFNAMGAIRAIEYAYKNEAKRAVKIISFESDLDALRLVLKNHPKFNHVHHPAPYALLENGEWQNKENPLSWELKLGDFFEHIHQSVSPDLIFYDPFSYKTNPKFWGIEGLGQVFSKCSHKSTMLITYTASTAIRAAFLATGFYVAKGAASGPKEDTTLALTPMAAKESRDLSFLSSDWIARFSRSDSRYPLDLKEEEKEGFQNKIFDHPQFKKGDGAKLI